MRVWVDQDLCTGDGLCVDHCPESFVLLEDGISYVRDGELVGNDPGGSASAVRVDRRCEDHVTAAALASENKSCAHPASVDSLPTSANQEDHVSMSTYAARRLVEMARNCGKIVAIELLAAAQGIDLRRPLSTTPALSAVMNELRARADFLDQDRSLAPDIEAVHALVRDGWFLNRLWPGERDRPVLG